MNIIQRKDQVFLNKVMDAYYDEVIEMSYHAPPFLLQEVGFIPSLNDVTVKILSDKPFEEVAFSVIRCCQDHHIFLRFRDGYINFPIGEVW
jgi:hypothetical protein